MKKTRLQLEYEPNQLQKRLEQNTKAFQRVMVRVIFGGFAMVAALSSWAHMAY